MTLTHADLAAIYTACDAEREAVADVVHELRASARQSLGFLGLAERWQQRNPGNDRLASRVQRGLARAEAYHRAAQALETP